MFKRMEPVEVRATRGEVEIKQDVGNGDDPAVVLLHPSQIPTLIAWLREAKKEAEAE